MWKWPRKQPNSQAYDDSRLIRRHPELSYLDNPEDRFTVYCRAIGAARKGTSLWAFLLMVVLMICWDSCFRVLEEYAPSSWWDYISDSGGIICLFSAGCIILHLRNRQFSRSLRAQFVRRGVPICINCGYDLRGQPESRCPECGVRFNPELLKGIEAWPRPPQPTVEQEPTQPAKLGTKATRQERKAAHRLEIFPDLALFPAEERDALWTQARKGTAIWTVAGVIVVCVGTVASIGIFEIFVAPRVWTSVKSFRNAIAIATLIVLADVCQSLARWLRGTHTERFLREQLNLRGHALCLKCGYDLKGQTAPGCPECGTAFDPALLLHPPTEPPRP